MQPSIQGRYPHVLAYAENPHLAHLSISTVERETLNLCPVESHSHLRAFFGQQRALEADLVDTLRKLQGLLRPEIYHKIISTTLTSSQHVQPPAPQSVPPFSAPQLALTLLHDDDISQFEEPELCASRTEQPSSLPTQNYSSEQQQSLSTIVPPCMEGPSVASSSSKKSRSHTYNYSLLDKVPVPQLAKHIRSRVSPYLLFRSALSHPSSLLSDPWYLSAADMKLDCMWDPKGQWRNDQHTTPPKQLPICPPTAYLIHALKRKQQATRNRILADGNISDLNQKSTSLEVRHQRRINETRLLLEKQNMLRETEDMKSREEILLTLRQGIYRPDVLRLTGIESELSWGDVPLPLSSSEKSPGSLANFLKNTKRDGAAWGCSTLTLRDVCEALLSFNPPLFVLSTSVPTTKEICDVPRLRVTRPVIEHLGIIIETQVKHILTHLLKYASFTADGGEEKGGLSDEICKKENNDAKNKLTITVESIEKLMASGGLDFLPFGALVASARIHSHKFLKMG